MENLKLVNNETNCVTEDQSETVQLPEQQTESKEGNLVSDTTECTKDSQYESGTDETLSSENYEDKQSVDELHSPKQAATDMNLSSTYPYLSTPQAAMGLVTAQQQPFVVPYGIHPSVVTYTGGPMPLHSHGMPIMSQCHPAMHTYPPMPYVGLPPQAAYGFAPPQIPILPNLIPPHPAHTAVRPDMAFATHLNTTGTNAYHIHTTGADYTMQPVIMTVDTKNTLYGNCANADAPLDEAYNSAAGNQDPNRPRRNKKKRPPGYYDQAAEQEAINRRKLEEQSQLVSTDMSHSDGLMSPESHTSEETSIQSSSSKPVLSSNVVTDTDSVAPSTEHKPEITTQVTQKVFFDSSLAPKSSDLIFSSEIQFLSDDILPDSVINNDQSSALANDSCNSCSMSSSVIQSQPDPQAAAACQKNNNNSIKDISFEADELTFTVNDEITENICDSVVNPSLQTENVRPETHSEETLSCDQEKPRDSECDTKTDLNADDTENNCSCGDGNTNTKQEAVPPQKSSWADLFRGTKSAQGAIVISSKFFNSIGILFSDFYKN